MELWCLEGASGSAGAVVNIFLSAGNIFLLAAFTRSGTPAVAASWISLACMLVSLVTAIWLGMVTRAPQYRNDVSDTPFGRLRIAADALTPTQQMGVAASLSTQIDALVAAGRIDPTLALEAKQQPLGALMKWAVVRKLDLRAKALRR